MRHPPKFADKLLEWFCKEELLEEIKGDLHEYYFKISQQQTTWQVRRSYWIHVLNFLRPFALKRFNNNSIIGTMIQSHIKMTFRNLLKYKFYSSINIFGLALGILASIFILIWIADEVSYDKFFENSERIYRVSTDIKFADNKWNMAMSPAPMAKVFEEEFPEIIKAGRLRAVGSVIFIKGDRYVQQKDVMYADPEILDIFSFEFLKGDRETALQEPNTVVITVSTANKFYKDKDPLGQTITTFSGKEYRIDGVIKDIPRNSHFHPSLLLSIKSDKQSENKIWLSNNYYTYFLLNESNDSKALENKFESVYPKYLGPQVEQAVGVNWDQVLASDNHVKFYLTNLEDIHLKSSLDYEIEANGDEQYVYLFSYIGLFILLIACINFMNISTARATVRGREVGIRKVLGSVKKDLISQFLTESIIYSLLALFIAYGLYHLLAPFYELLTEKQVLNPLFDEQMLWVYILSGTIFMGLLAGIYPAFVLSGFNPLNVLKGQMKAGKPGTTIRGILVVFQFSISLILIIGTLVVFKQLQFIQNKALGFKKDGILVINNGQILGNQMVSFKNKLMDNTNIENVSATGFLPIDGYRSDNTFWPEGMNSKDDAISLQTWSVDYNYINTLGMELVKGRNFSRDMASDSSGVIINETAMHRLGYSDEVLGKKLTSFGDFMVNGMHKFNIIGVVKDFHFKSLKENISPLMLYLNKDPTSSVIAVRFSSDNVKSIIGEVEEVWKAFNPNHPMQFNFLDRQFDNKYKEEVRLGRIFTVFGVFAIIIACLGLFGLSSFTAEQKKKEMGIRKVLGASDFNLLKLLFLGYTKLILIAISIGIPVAYIFMSGWLQDFAYHTKLDFIIFIGAAILSLAVAWLTVSIQSIKVARANPAVNLRTE
ncbi:MAG TPA: ABC transporter permease [Cyclobacteriaceae bacterium]